MYIIIYTHVHVHVHIHVYIYIYIYICYSCLLFCRPITWLYMHYVGVLFILKYLLHVEQIGQLRYGIILESESITHVHVYYMRMPVSKTELYFKRKTSCYDN